MSSFKDQFLKAGVIDAKKAKKATIEKRKAQKQQKNVKGTEIDAAKAAAAKAHAEKVARDRKLNEARKAESETKALRAQIKQLVDEYRQPKDDSDDAVAYNFTDGKHVKTIHVSPLTRDQLIQGVLVIVLCDAAYELVPAQVAAKIAQRDEFAVVHQQEANAASDDDPYAEYQIPDDLMW